MPHPSAPARSRTSWLIYLTILSATGPMSIDLYLPSLPEIARAFSASVGEVQTTLSIFMIGFAASQLVAGPLSDRFGRRPVIVGGMLLYFVASLLCRFAPTIELLIAGRLFQALGACVGPVVGRAIVRDLYEPDKAVGILAAMGTAMAAAPALAPILGGWLLEVFDWRAPFAGMAIFAALLLGGTLLTLPETNAHRGTAAISPTGIARNFATLLGHRVFRAYAALLALTFGGIFCFVSGSSFVLIEVLGLAPADFGYAFACVVAGLALGSILAGRFARSLRPHEIAGFGVALLAISASVMAGLAWAGVATVAAILAPMAGFAVGVAMIMPTAMAASIGPFPRIAGSASSLAGFAQGVTAASAGWIVAALHDGTTRGFATALLGFAAAAALAYLSQVRAVSGAGRS